MLSRPPSAPQSSGVLGRAGAGVAGGAGSRQAHRLSDRGFDLFRAPSASTIATPATCGRRRTWKCIWRAAIAAWPAASAPSVPQFGDPARAWRRHAAALGRRPIRDRRQAAALLGASSIGLIETGLSILANANVFLEGRSAHDDLAHRRARRHRILAVRQRWRDCVAGSHEGAAADQDAGWRKGRVDPDRDLITLDSLALDIDGPTFELAGAGDGFLRGRATDDGAPVLTATLKGTGIDWKKLDGWWPETMAADSRGWLIPNITSGIVEDLDAKTKVRFPQGETAVGGGGRAGRHLQGARPDRALSAPDAADRARRRDRHASTPSNSPPTSRAAMSATSSSARATC